MRNRDRFFGKQTWYSVCSMHREYTEDCHMCIVGTWHTDWVLSISSWFYKKYPKLWVWLVNTKLWVWLANKGWKV